MYRPTRATSESDDSKSKEAVRKAQFSAASKMIVGKIPFFVVFGLEVKGGGGKRSKWVNNGES